MSLQRVLLDCLAFWRLFCLCCKSLLLMCIFLILGSFRDYLAFRLFGKPLLLICIVLILWSTSTVLALRVCGWLVSAGTFVSRYILLTSAQAVCACEWPGCLLYKLLFLLCLLVTGGYIVEQCLGLVCVWMSWLLCLKQPLSFTVYHVFCLCGYWSCRPLHFYHSLPIQVKLPAPDGQCSALVQKG